MADRIGHYEVVSLLGKGGMGEVYRAHDPQLNRDVAIKVLPATLANDADYLARFQREAQTLAALNHPNIAAIYGLEGKAIVMELVEGATLQGPLPLAEALPLARQIAEALEAAHEKGIIHRDLKPGNVKVTPEGVVKVLDFGLAKAVSERPVSTGPDSPTLTMRATEAGLILGTAGYMSPEQAAGKNVDRRADIWSFGVVLYELLTGKRLFDGETVTHTLADVVRAPIDLTGVPLRELLERCLDRNIKTRLQHIGEARIALENYQETPKQKAVTRNIWLPWAAAGVFAVAAVVLAFGRFNRHSDTKPSLALELSLPSGCSTPRVSPNGKAVAVTCFRFGIIEIWSREFAAVEWKKLATGDRIAIVRWSPDSRSLVFITGGRLMEVAWPDGVTTELAKADGFWGFGEGGEYLFSRAGGDGLLGMKKGVGEPRKATGFRKGPIQMLPGGSRYVNLGQGGSLYLASTASSEAHQIIKDVRLPSVIPDDEGAGATILYLRASNLFARRFDMAKAQFSGAEKRIAENVGYFSASNNGVLVYQRANEASQLAWVDRAGAVLSNVGEPGHWGTMALDRDEKRAVLVNRETNDLWMMDFLRGIKSRFTTGDGRDVNPLWTPDGSSVVWMSSVGDTSTTYIKKADGSGSAETITKGGQPLDFSPDGKLFLFSRNRLLWTSSWMGDKKETQVRKAEFNESYGKFSPDGKWLAYSSNESGRIEVFVQPFPPSGARTQISSNGGNHPQWSGNGRELYYLQGRNLMAVEVATGPALSAGVPKLVLKTGPLVSSWRSYIPSKDGKRFLMNLHVSDPDIEPATVLINWDRDLPAGN